MKRLVIVPLLAIGCMSAPRAADYKGRPAVCLDFARCLYYNQKNPDKSICASLAKECANFERMIYCGDEEKRPKDVTFQACWDKLQ